MYDFFKQVCQNNAYKDLNAFLSKLYVAWGKGLITNDQLDELTIIAQGNAPKKLYDLQEEVDRLWATIRQLEVRSMCAQSDGNTGNEGTAQADVPAFVQPSGAHDAYHIEDRVRYKGKVYVSTLDGNVWAPDVYPAGWTEL